MLQFSELLGQHALADARNLPAKLAKTMDTVFKPEQNQGFPLATDYIQRCLNRTSVIRKLSNVTHVVNFTYQKVSTREIPTSHLFSRGRMLRHLCLLSICGTWAGPKASPRS